MAPEWFTRRKEKLDREASEKRLNNARESLAKSIIRESGAVYFVDLLSELREQCEHLPEVGFKGNAYPMPNPHNPMELCTRIDVQANRVYPDSTFAVLLYSTGDSIMRVSGEIPKFHELSFGIFGEELKTATNQGMSYMNPKQCAECLIESLLDVIERRS